jgi:NAD(P)H-nitrite reductase large subunit
VPSALCWWSTPTTKALSNNPDRPAESEAEGGIAPYIPGGLLTPELMRRIADVAEKYQVKAVKITGATHLALIGFKCCAEKLHL